MKALNRKTTGLNSNRAVKVIQFGEGNFLRGFVDWIIDILNEKTAFQGDVHIVQPIKNGMGDLINKQEGLYHTLIEGLHRGKKIQQTRMISCVRGVINPYEDYTAFLELAEHPDLEFIISNTTEAGIQFNPQDLRSDSVPETFPGKLTALLYRRFTYYKPAHPKKLIIIPCELIESNGDKLKATIMQYITLWELPERFKNWVEEHIIFCNTLVDRIVPGFPKDNITEIQAKLGFEDRLLVKAEPFHLWVIEAPNFVAQAFPATKAGLNVNFVKDIRPYRSRKVSILNGAHTAMVAYGHLHGIKTVSEMLDNPKTYGFIQTLIFDEIIPTLELDSLELSVFAEAVLERFRNPFIKHNLMTIALNSVSKFKVRVLPSLIRYIAMHKKLPTMLVRAMAYLIVFYRGNYGGKKIELNDDLWVLDFFTTVWKANTVEIVVARTLAHTDFWDIDLTHIPGLQQKITEEITMILNQENQIKENP